MPRSPAGTPAESLSGKSLFSAPLAILAIDWAKLENWTQLHYDLFFR